MILRNVVLACTSAFVLLACGASSDTSTTSSSSGGAGAAAEATSAVTTFEALTLQTSAAVAAYRDAALGAGFSLATCAQVHDGYDAQVRARIAQMAQLASDMDSIMAAHHGADHADLGCVSTAMLGELDRHRTMACTFTDAAADRDEVNRHAAAMTSFCGHAEARCRELGGVLDGGGASWGPMITACSTADDAPAGDGGWGHGHDPMHGAGMP